MTVTILRRVDPERNEAWFYTVLVGASLFDAHAVVRFWGRIGGFQRMLVTPCGSLEEAEGLARRLVQRRKQRGYEEIGLEWRASSDPEEDPLLPEELVEDGVAERGGVQGHQGGPSGQ